VPVTAGVVDPTAVEKEEGVDVLPVPELARVLPLSDIIAVDPLSTAVVVVPLPDELVVWLEGSPVVSLG